ncbi:Iron-sulfur cluster assembly 2, mitochondrial [Araneus ventricosus]|uniref:Iron-sulfur cluster assembly 2 homolog, mitochondrial n=1 Tax=Araneus ventricosus TaxID=182803 RepID=A0A4Y2KWK5_ARAVE|nr:Iron-sulfur cluster assembly 2, mitochondrial [Araneus ventricosus]
MFISFFKNICINTSSKYSFISRLRPVVSEISRKHFSTDKRTYESNSLSVSESCVNRLKQIAGDGAFLRITVDGGGCSGFQYKFDLDSEVKEDDVCFERDGAKVVVDKISLDFLKGSTVEYKEELIRSAFRIADNPQADSKCSCGTSFSVKMP